MMAGSLLGMEPLRLDPEPHTGRVGFRHDYYVWCRKHERARKASVQCCECDCDTSVNMVPIVHRDWCSCNDPCVPIGPSMSEDEANHAGGLRRCMRCDDWIRFAPEVRNLPSHPSWVHLKPSKCKMPLPVHITPLGMEIER